MYLIKLNIIIKIVLDETVVDVLDDSSIISSGLNFEIIYKGSNLINFKFRPNIEGVWLMASSMNGESTTEVLTICNIYLHAKLPTF